MKGGNDIVGILSTLALNAKFANPILAPNREVELTVVDTVPHLGTKVPKGSTVLITAYSRCVPFVAGLQATAKLEGSGCLAGIDVSNAPSPELAKTVSYQGIPNLDGKVTLKVYAPYYQGKEPQTSTATPATPPSAGGTPPSASAGGAGGLVTCGSQAADYSSRPASILRAQLTSLQRWACPSIFSAICALRASRATGLHSGAMAR
jgi:hypothetical protein